VCVSDSSLLKHSIDHDRKFFYDNDKDFSTFWHENTQKYANDSTTAEVREKGNKFRIPGIFATIHAI
jgi:hypothetical protein